jgi:hypothetical protein
MSRESPAARSARSATSPKLAAAAAELRGVRVLGVEERPGYSLDEEGRGQGAPGFFVANLGFNRVFRCFKYNCTPSSVSKSQKVK